MGIPEMAKAGFEQHNPGQKWDNLSTKDRAEWYATALDAMVLIMAELPIGPEWHECVRSIMHFNRIKADLL